MVDNVALLHFLVCCWLFGVGTLAFSPAVLAVSVEGVSANIVVADVPVLAILGAVWVMVQVLGGSGGSGIPGAFWCGFLEVAVSFVFGMCRDGHVLGGSGSFLDVSLTLVGRWSVVLSWFKRFIVGGSGLGSSVGSGWFRVVPGCSGGPCWCAGMVPEPLELGGSGRFRCWLRSWFQGGSASARSCISYHLSCWDTTWLYLAITRFAF